MLVNTVTNNFHFITSKFLSLLKSRTSKDVVTVYIGKVIEALLGLVSSILVARELGPMNLGILMSLIAFANILGCFMGYGLEVTVVKFIADYRNNNVEEVCSVLQHTIAIRLIFIIIIGFTAVVFHNYLIKEYIKSVTSNSLFLLSIVLAACNSLFFYCQSAIRGYQLFTKNVVSNTIGRSLRLVVIICYIIAGTLTVEIVLYANIVSALVVVLIDALHMRSLTNIPNRTVTINISFLRNIFKYSFWLYGASILGVAFNNMNIMMLNYYSAAMTVGLYAMAENLLRPFEFLPETLNQVFLPKISKIQTREEFFKYMKKIIILGIIMSFCMVPFIIFPKTIISFFYGDKFTNGSLVLQIMTLYLCINIFLNPLYIFAHRLNMPKMFTLSGTLALIVGFVANAQLIPRFGEVGCALTLLTVCVVSKTIVLPSIFFKARRILL